MPHIKNSSITELTERIDMKAIVENYVKLERRGGKWWGCCPFHGEATPSFNIDTEKKVYYCFGCGKGGSVINFVMEIEKLNFPEAIEFIAKKVGFRLQYDEGGKYEKANDDKKEILDLYSKVVSLFHSVLILYPQGEEALNYLKNRGITKETIEKFQLGFAPKERNWLYNFLIKKSYTPQFLAKTGLFSSKYNNIAFFSNRIMFPIFDRYGTPIAFGGRRFSGEEGPKYLNTKDMEQYKKGNSLFAFSLAMKGIREKKSVILCEGYMDVISYHQAGITNAVAPLGTALTEEQVRTLKNLTDNFYLSFDSDEAGQKATYKAILMIRQFGGEVRVISIQGGKDPSEVLEKEGCDALSLLVKNAIIDEEYLLHLASGKFSGDKIQAIFFLFPYIRALVSTVYREEVVRRLSVFFHVTEDSVLSDYTRYLEGGEYKENKTVKKSMNNMGILMKTAEMRLLLAVVVNRELFMQLRSEVRLEDFEDIVAKQLYIALEECFREGKESYDDLIGKCENPELQKLIIQVINTDEFSKENSENILEDGIKLISLNRLKKRRRYVVNRLHVLSLDNVTDDREVQDLLMEKKELDGQISNIR